MYTCISHVLKNCLPELPPFSSCAACKACGKLLCLFNLYQISPPVVRMAIMKTVLMLAAIAPIAPVERPDDDLMAVVRAEAEEVTIIEVLAARAEAEVGGIIDI
jgi:hypothetical protein